MIANTSQCVSSAVVDERHRMQFNQSQNLYKPLQSGGYIHILQHLYGLYIGIGKFGNCLKYLYIHVCMVIPDRNDEEGC